MKAFSESSKSKNEVEKMLNLIQQCCLNAWVFNDVAKSLEGIGFNENDLKNLGILSDENQKMKKLNDAARGTTMFKEFQINKLIKDTKLTKDATLSEESVAEFLNKWGRKKSVFAVGMVSTKMTSVYLQSP